MGSFGVNISLLVIMASLLFAGCAKEDNGDSSKSAPMSQAVDSPQTSPTSKPNDSQPTVGADAQAYKIRCQKGDAFTVQSGKSLTLEDLLKSLRGKYELDQVRIHQTATAPDGKYIGAFQALATRYIESDASLGDTQIRNTDLQFVCDEYNKDSGVPFVSGVSVPVAGIMHSPSGRITVFDQGSSMDNPQFNLPLVAEVHFASVGYAHYINATEDSGPPYLRGRHFIDVIRRYSVEPKFYARPSGGFEMRVSWTEQKSLGEGRSFTTETDVVITYKRYE